MTALLVICVIQNIYCFLGNVHDWVVTYPSIYMGSHSWEKHYVVPTQLTHLDFKTLGSGSWPPTRKENGCVFHILSSIQAKVQSCLSHYFIVSFGIEQYIIWYYIFRKESKYILLCLLGLNSTLFGITYLGRKGNTFLITCKGNMPFIILIQNSKGVWDNGTCYLYYFLTPNKKYFRADFTWHNFFPINTISFKWEE